MFALSARINLRKFLILLMPSNLGKRVTLSYIISTLSEKLHVLRGRGRSSVVTRVTSLPPIRISGSLLLPPSTWLMFNKYVLKRTALAYYIRTLWYKKGIRSIFRGKTEKLSCSLRQGWASSILPTPASVVPFPAFLSFLISHLNPFLYQRYALVNMINGS